MSYISREQISPDGAASAFTLANPFKAGTLLITYNNKLFYEFRDDNTNKDKVVFDFIPPVTAEIYAYYYTIDEPNVQNALRYISPRQVLDRSRVSTLIAETESEIEKIIREVEQYIDTACGNWARYYKILGDDSEFSGQSLTFPRVEDSVEGETNPTTSYPPIPEKLTTAALYAVENVYLMGAATSADLGEESIESESLGDYSYKKTSKGSAITDAVSASKAMLGNRALSMLAGYMKHYGNMSLNDDTFRDSQFLNSRQRWKTKITGI